MDKLAFILLFFVLPFKVFSDGTNPDYSVIEKDNKKGLTDTRGNIVIPPAYEDIGWSSGPPVVYHDRIGYKENGKWGLLNLKNEKITVPQFTSVSPVSEEIFIASIPDEFRLSSLAGLVNYDGKPISGFLFNELKSAGNYFIAGVRKNTVTHYGIISDKGKVTIPLNYRKVNYIGYDLFSVSDENNNIYLFKGNGELVTRFTLDDIGPFQHDFARIESHGKSGLINTSGKVLLEPEYREIKISENGTISYLPFPVWKLIDDDHPVRLYYDSILQITPDRYIGFAGSAMNFIDSSGNCSATFYNLDENRLVNGEVIAKDKKKYGLLDRQGKLVFPFLYDSIVTAPAYIMLKRKKDSESRWMLGDHYGAIVNHGPFDEFFPVNNVYLLARRKGYWGIVFADGTEKVNCIYDSIQAYMDGLLKVTFHHESGLLWNNNWLVYPGKHRITLLPDKRIIVTDYTGSVVLNVLADTLYQSEDILTPLENHFLVKSRDNRYGLLSSDFERILYPVCYSIHSLPQDSMFVFHNQDGWGAVGKNDRILFANVSHMDSILSYSEGYFRVIIDGDYGFVDREGKLRIANRYENAGDFLNGIVPVKLVDRWGFVNVSEKLVIQPFYDMVQNNPNNLIIVKKDDRYGIIDPAGHVVQDIDYSEIIPLSTHGYLVRQDHRFGFVNQKGKLVITPRFDRLQWLENGTFIACSNKKCGIVSDTGDTLIPLSFDRLNYDNITHQLWGKVNAVWKSY